MRCVPSREVEQARVIRFHWHDGEVKASFPLEAYHIVHFARRRQRHDEAILASTRGAAGAV